MRWVFNQAGHAMVSLWHKESLFSVLFFGGSDPKEDGGRVGCDAGHIAVCLNVQLSPIHLRVMQRRGPQLFFD
jgi:hypothetical protein